VYIYPRVSGTQWMYTVLNWLANAKSNALYQTRLGEPIDSESTF
jgi:hypothetical protein